MSALSVLSTNSSNYTRALYLRDQIDPSALPAFPPLTPQVNALAPVNIPAGAWEQWIADIDNAPVDGPMIAPRTAELARLYEEHQQGIGDWIAAHVDDDRFASYRPKWLPAMLASKSGEGQFACEVLPVSGVWWKDVSPARLLVSKVLYTDHALMDRMLTERVAPLLT